MFLYVPCFHLGELKLAFQMAECGLGRMAWSGALGRGTASPLTTVNLAQGLARSEGPTDTGAGLLPSPVWLPYAWRLKLQPTSHQPPAQPG